jgi:hypothetical protein
MFPVRFVAGAAIALAAVVGFAPAANAHTAKKSTTHTYSLQAIRDDDYPTIGSAKVEDREHTERINVSVNNGGLPAGDYTAYVVAGTFENISNPAIKKVCNFHVAAVGSGSCKADVHTKLLKSSLPLKAISVFPKGSNDFNNPVAVALISFG